MSINPIIDLDVSEIKKVLVLGNNIFCQTSGVESYLYQNGDADLISFPDGYSSPEVWYNIEKTIFGFIRKDNQEYLYKTDETLQNITLLDPVTSPESVVFSF